MDTLQKSQRNGQREPGTRGGRLRAAGTAGVLTGMAAGLLVLLPGLLPRADALPRAEAGIIAYRTYLDLHLPRPGEPGFREPAVAEDKTNNTANGIKSDAVSKGAKRAARKKQAPASGKLTLDQRAKLADERNRILQQWDTLSEEELRQAMTAFQEHVRAERMKNMGPAVRAPCPPRRRSMCARNA